MKEEILSIASDLREGSMTTNEAKEIEIELLKDTYSDGINAHRVNFCNRDEYFQRAFKENGYCPSCGKSSCCGDCS